MSDSHYPKGIFHREFHGLACSDVTRTIPLLKLHREFHGLASSDVTRSFPWGNYIGNFTFPLVPMSQGLFPC